MSKDSLIVRAEHRIYKTLKRNRLKNKGFTIFADNCNGGIILHDLGIPFDTPIVNLYFLPDDYLRFLHHPKRYVGKEPIETFEPDIDYPIGMIEDVKIYFMHYPSFEEARKKWLERSQRVHWDYLYVLMTDKNGCTEKHMNEFLSLPYEHKCFLTSEKIELPQVHYFSDFKDEAEVGILSDFKPGFLRRRYLDDFDYVSFLNH